MFRYPKLAENAGCGIDKVLRWKELTGNNVTFETDFISTVTAFWLQNPSVNPSVNGSDTANLPVNGDNLPVNLPANALDAEIVQILLREPRATYDQLAERLGKNRDTIRVHIKSLQQRGTLYREGSDKTGHWVVVPQ